MKLLTSWGGRAYIVYGTNSFVEVAQQQQGSQPIREVREKSGNLRKMPQIREKSGNFDLPVSTSCVSTKTGN